MWQKAALILFSLINIAGMAKPYQLGLGLG